LPIGRAFKVAQFPETGCPENSFLTNGRQAAVTWRRMDLM
jgi:hypothetical protein